MKGQDSRELLGEQLCDSPVCPLSCSPRSRVWSTELAGSSPQELCHVSVVIPSSAPASMLKSRKGTVTEYGLKDVRRLLE